MSSIAKRRRHLATVQAQKHPRRRSVKRARRRIQVADLTSG